MGNTQTLSFQTSTSIPSAPGTPDPNHKHVSVSSVVTAALTTFIVNGFQQNLNTGALFLDLTATYDTVFTN